MEQRNGSVFEVLNSINVNGRTETRKGSDGKELTYLSWAWAWSEVKKRFPDANYEIEKDANGLPYFGDPKIGYMVYTKVTIQGVTHEMWLPVMDGANNPLKAEPYVKKTKYKDVPVAAMTMFDVNKAVMRCLAKCLAMFGMALYLYTGEDLPECEAEEVETPKNEKKPEIDKKPDRKIMNQATVDDRKELFTAAKAVYGDAFADTLKGWFKEIGVSSSEELTKDQVKALLARINQHADEEYSRQSA